MFYANKLLPYSTLLDEFLDNRNFFNSPTSLSREDKVKDEGDTWSIELDVPSYEKNQIDIDFSQGVLTITGENESRGKFSRKFSVKRGVTADNITSTLKNGVLTVSVGKPEDDKVVKIPVK